MANAKLTDERILTGMCLCGAVRYEVADAFVYAMNCHCSNCRRTTGAAFKSIAGIQRNKFALTRGADNLLIVGEPDGNDAHCKSCGSFLYSIVKTAPSSMSPWAA